MTEAITLHDELVHALQLLIPQTTYHDLRRLNTLAWAITGVCLKQTVRLSAWAEVTQSRATLAASRLRHFARWLHQPAIVPAHWYQPVMQAALASFPPASRLYLALDTTALPPFVLIQLSLIYRGRAIPLAWRAMRHQSTTVAFEDYQPVLEQARTLLPESLVITLLADRGFVHQRLLHYVRDQHWHVRLRLMGKTLIHLPESVVAVRELAPPAGEHRFFQHIAILAAAFGPVHLAISSSLDHPLDPWFVASDEPASALTLEEYALRFETEGAFLDQKSGGFQLHRSELATPHALERLLLIIALSTLYLTSIGAGVVRSGKHRWVDHHWDRGLSYLQLGARWLRQQEQRGWQSFASFRLDPSPDPLPALASRRAAAERSREAELPNAA